MKTVIEMAREAGFIESNDGSVTILVKENTGMAANLKLLAALVREDEREKLFEELMEMHREANGQHNYYQYAVIQLRGEPV